ncbi:Xylosyltransferase 2 [Dinochytrium kinnereticum]|nr:Xylosyltransferase 2 [Dinochytrium kinnereticum]
MYKTGQILGLFKAKRPERPEPLPLTAEQQLKFDAPLFSEKETIDALAAASTTTRYFKIDGFNFCRILNNASFDSLATISQWEDSVASRNPSPEEFVGFIDGEATRLAKTLHKYAVYNKEEVDRFSCFSVAEGANPFANVSHDRLLHRIEPVNYFSDLIPSIQAVPQSLIPGPRRKYHFAYLMMVHGNKTTIENVKNLIDIIDDGSAIILIHVDLKSRELYGAIQELITLRDALMNEKIRPNQPPIPGNVHLATNRYDGLWGHASLVNIEVSGFWELLDLADWDFVINISGLDYPLRHSREIYRVMSLKKNKGREFISWWEDTSQEAFRIVRPYLSRTNKILKGSKLVTEMTSYHPLEAVALNTPYFSKRTVAEKKHYFQMSYNDKNHAAILDTTLVRYIGVDHNRDSPRYFFARKVDLRTNKGKEVAKWVQREHLKKHLQAGGYGELPGSPFVDFKGKGRKKH